MFGRSIGSSSETSRSLTVAAAVLALMASTACEFKRISSTGPSPAPTPSPSPAPESTAFLGTWSSTTATPTLDAKTCSAFQWSVTTQTATTISGAFTAVCLGNVQMTGSGSGVFENNTLRITLAGFANLPTGRCDFAVAGTGTYDGNAITVPYSGSTCLGPVSGTETLRRGSLPGPPPPPPPAPPAPEPPPPPPPPAPRVPCALGNGSRIVDCVAATFPERLVGNISLSERQANMAFLRDRIIEAGKCSGLDFGWNLKRGGPELSIDFLAWRQGAVNIGVDLGFDYDNLGRRLELQWLEVGPGAFYAAYPAPTCG